MRILLPGSGLLLCALLLAGCATSPDAARGDTLEARLLEIERRGRLIYEADTLTAGASDALLAHVSTHGESRIEGYVAYPNEGRVDWLRTEDGEIVKVFSVAAGEDESFDIRSHEPPEPVPAAEAARFRAFLAARARFEPICDAPYNAVVLPSSEPEGWLVYFLAATTSADVAILTGHVRMLVAPDGQEVTSVSPLSRTCVMTARSPSEEGAKTAGFVLNHVLGDIPEETHVFSSLLYETPIFILTRNNAMWDVEEGRIERMER